MTRTRSDGGVDDEVWAVRGLNEAQAKSIATRVLTPFACRDARMNGQTNVQVEIQVVGELEIALTPFLQNPTLHPTFVRREDGKPYTVDGIGAMFRRYCNKANVSDFGLRDLRAKGATDMFRADPNSIRKIQLLLGHKSVQTTEIYLKGRLTEIVRPNERPIIALVR